MHIRRDILQELKQGNNAITMAEKMCDVYVSDMVIDRATRNWFVEFRFGDKSFEGEPKTGCSLDFNNDTLKMLGEQNPRQMTKKLTDKLNMSRSTVSIEPRR